jgi:hypothetical protein
MKNDNKEQEIEKEGVTGKKGNAIPVTGRGGP